MAGRETWHEEAAIVAQAEHRPERGDRPDRGLLLRNNQNPRIASPEMLPKDLSLPQLKCSPAVDNRGSRDEAGEHGDQE
jgi:hypothetical protein